MNRTISLIGYSFSVVGTGLLLGGLFMASRQASFLASAERASGEVLSLEPVASRNSDTGRVSTLYRPVVRFVTASGQSVVLHETASTNPPAYDVGERVTVFYEAGKPQDGELDGWFSLWFAPTLLGGIGLVFGSIGGGMLYARRRRRLRAEELRAGGRAVETRFQNVELNTSLTVNGRHPWRITTQWIDPNNGGLHVFESENLWFDPAAHIGQRTITVFIDPHNPKRYHMDVSFLPTLVE